MNAQDRYQAFIEQLTALSKEHGIAIQAIGGLRIYGAPSDVAGIEYSDDHTSGDLEYTLPRDRDPADHDNA